MSDHLISLIPAIIGPTAVGKTTLSLLLAEQLGGEIISVDSRQIYRQLTIGTAKPTAEERTRVRHHFIDELDLTEPFSAGLFAEAATRRIVEVIERGRIPIVVGGSTLYIEALLHGLANIPTTSPSTRAELMARLQLEGPDALFRELQEIDPVSSATMDATKTQRIVRALEVYQDTGQPLSSFYAAYRPDPRFRFSPIVLTRPRDTLYKRINQRVDQMLEAGLLEENRRIRKSGISPKANPLRTIGYREPQAYLRNEVTYEEMVRLLKRNTRRYAKRQLTWFRRHETYVWISIHEDRGIGSTLSEVLKVLS